MPGTGEALGHTHILTQTMQEIIAVFEQMGFVTIETPEIETEFHNFTGLNIPIDHPSRDAFDTFYLDAEDPSAKGRRLLLRSHTSPGQVRIMKQHKPPMAVIVPGRCIVPTRWMPAIRLCSIRLKDFWWMRRCNFPSLKDY